MTNIREALAERAADMLTAYAELIRRDGASHVEEHHYLPEVEYTATELRECAALAAQPAQEVVRDLGAAFEEMLKMHPANQRWNAQATENDPDPLPQERHLGFDQEAGNIRGYTASDMRDYAVRFAQRRMLDAQPAQEAQPVAWKSPDGSIREDEGQHEPPFDDWKPLYAAPVAAQPAQPLPSDPDKPHAINVPGYGWVAVKAVRAVERAHGIGEKP